MGPSAPEPSGIHFQDPGAEQRAMSEGAAARLRAYRRLLPSSSARLSPELHDPPSEDALRGRFWDAVVLTAANASQARVYGLQLDGLHARGQLPGDRSRYVVVPDPPGPRAGSGGATLHVMLTLQATVGNKWKDARILLLHAGGYSERSPAHGTLGKAFGQLPLAAGNVGIPATILEAQLVYYVDLPAMLPPGIFVSSADVILQFGSFPTLSEDERERAAGGLLALGHASTVQTGTEHGVFACDETALKALISRHIESSQSPTSTSAATHATQQPGSQFAGEVAMRRGTDAATSTASPSGDEVEASVPAPFSAGPVVLDCCRCLQKPSEAAMREAGAVMMTSPPNVRTAGVEWVLTDSAFHIGHRACDALIRLASAHLNDLTGVELCAYGDMMQPLGTAPNTAYLSRTNHVASLAGSAQAVDSARGSHGAAAHPAARLRRARELIAGALRGCPLLVLPLLPSRFVHVGTMPELLHAVSDAAIMEALPGPPAGLALGTWDRSAMDKVGNYDSMGPDGVWGRGKSSGPGACLCASLVGRGARVGVGSVIMHCDVGSLATVGAGCLLHDVDLPKGAVVPAGIFMHCVPLGQAAAIGAGLVDPMKLPLPPSQNGKGGKTEGGVGGAGRGAGCWVCIVLHVNDEVKKVGASTLCGVPVADAAGRLGLDTAKADSATWVMGEAQTTTMARVFPVCATAAEAATAGLNLLATVRGDLHRGLGPSSSRLGVQVSKLEEPSSGPGLRVSIHEALRVLAQHEAAVERREALRRRIIGMAVGKLLANDTPADQWLLRCPLFRSVTAADFHHTDPGLVDGGVETSVNVAVARGLALARLADPKAADDDAAGIPATRQTLLVAGRIALALAEGPVTDSSAELAAKRLLRAAVTAPFSSSPPLFGRPAGVAAAARVTAAGEATNRATIPVSIGTWTGSPAGLDIPAAPTAAAVSRQGLMAAVRAEYPARLNLAGGWTDTPPYSLERQGVVLHVPVLTAGGVGGVPGGGMTGDRGGDTSTLTANGNRGVDGGMNTTTVAGGGGGLSGGGSSGAVKHAIGMGDAPIGGRLRRPISATAVRLPGMGGVLRLVSEPGPGVPGYSEEIRTTATLLSLGDPSHPFALHRACVALAVVPTHAATAPEATAGPRRRERTVPPPKLSAALQAFLGAPGVGLELRTRVDLPRGSGLGTSSLLALASLHALHELSTGCEWRPGGQPRGAGAARWAGRSAVVVPPGESDLRSVVGTGNSKAAATPPVQETMKAKGEGGEGDGNRGGGGDEGGGKAREEADADLVAFPGSPPAPTKQQQREQREEQQRLERLAQAEAAAEAATESRPTICWPSARDVFNAVLAVEQMMGTGGGWQDQVGGALEGMRLTTAAPGDLGNCPSTFGRGPNPRSGTGDGARDQTPGRGFDSLPEYNVRIAVLPPAAAAFLSRHVACVFTGTCRLAASVAKGVVDGWQRRTEGVEESLRECAAIGREMTASLDRLGALPPASFTGPGSPAAQAELAAFGAALERHKVIQEKLWPSISSPTVVALYKAVEKLATGSHICGAGNGGHVMVFLKPGVTLAAVVRAVEGCEAAPDAKVVRVQMMLGGGGSGMGRGRGGARGSGDGGGDDRGQGASDDVISNGNGGGQVGQDTEGRPPEIKRQRTV